VSDSTECLYIVRGLQVPLKVYLLEITNGTDPTKVRRK